MENQIARARFEPGPSWPRIERSAVTPHWLDNFVRTIDVPFGRPFLGGMGLGLVRLIPTHACRPRYRLHGNLCRRTAPHRFLMSAILRQLKTTVDVRIYFTSLVTKRESFQKNIYLQLVRRLKNSTTSVAFNFICLWG